MRLDAPKRAVIKVVSAKAGRCSYVLDENLKKVRRKKSRETETRIRIDLDSRTRERLPLTAVVPQDPEEAAIKRINLSRPCRDLFQGASIRATRLEARARCSPSRTRIFTSLERAHRPEREAIVPRLAFQKPSLARQIRNPKFADLSNLSRCSLHCPPNRRKVRKERLGRDYREKFRKDSTSAQTTQRLRAGNEINELTSLRVSS